MQNPFYIQAPDVLGQYARGLQIGQAEAQMAKQAEAEKAAAAYEQQMQADLAQLYSNPQATARDYSQIMLKYPQVADNLKKAWDVQSAEVQDAGLSEMTQVYSAINQGRPDIAVSMFRQKEQAALNSGDEEAAQRFAAMADFAETDPKALQVSVGSQLFALKGGEYLEKLGASPYAGYKAEAEARQAQAKAMQEEATAGTAEDMAALEAEKAAEDVKTARFDRQLKVIDAQLASDRVDIDREKLQMDRDKIQAEKDKLASEKTTAAQDAISSASTAIMTVNKALNHPGLQPGTGAFSDFKAWFNGSDAADFRSTLGTIKSQQFLNNVVKGLGAISNEEGKRFESAIASLDTSQSDKQMVENLTTIRDTLRKIQEKAVESKKAPMSGGTVVAKTKKYGVVREGDVNRLMAANPGATREQVIRFLESQQ